jgi:hypothetical protein
MNRRELFAAVAGAVAGMVATTTGHSITFRSRDTPPGQADVVVNGRAVRYGKTQLWIQDQHGMWVEVPEVQNIVFDNPPPRQWPRMWGRTI